MRRATRTTPTLPEVIACPKLPRTATGYRYYAGFSEEFVRDVLRLWPAGTRVLDPWNGSGTTTRVATDLGLQSVGIDLNPAMAVIAKSDLTAAKDVDRILATARAQQNRPVARAELLDSDPLRQWFDGGSVRKIRGLQVDLVGKQHFTNSEIDELAPDSAFWLAALFKVVKRHLASWRSSNPTWIKASGPLTSIGWHALLDGVLDQANSAVARANAGTARIGIGSASNLVGFGSEYDLILGSPPYLTRIDYAVATRVELSVLGIRAEEQEMLRRTLLGTTTVPHTSAVLLPDVGTRARTTLAKIETHGSKASGSYYRKWFTQYLAGYAGAIEQLTRATVLNATIGVVVQDSYYKEIHLDLPGMTIEMMASRGWGLHRLYEFAPRRSMAQINPRAIAYTRGAIPNEKALFFRRQY